jgi:hypothetical protein
LHIESHGSLVQWPARTDLPPCSPDAIVVPTIRPQSLRPAAALARSLDCQLVVLCSAPDQARQALAACESLVDRLFVTWVPRSMDFSPHMSFLTSGHPDCNAVLSCHVDIARKRNTALLLGRLTGWRTVFFLDDDIRDLSGSDVQRAAALSGQYDAVGFETHYYPDNSVVCHAHRLAGGQQGIFPGGSAMVVNLDHCKAFFPPIYNEDWLFLSCPLQDRSVAAAGTVSQLDYQPFTNPRRAESEEFGDVVAEGVFRLIHRGADVMQGDSSYWEAVLTRRARLIDDIAARLLSNDTQPSTTGRALLSLTAAQKRLASISPLSCVSFIRAWHEDLCSWRERISNLATLGDVSDAAKFLELQRPEELRAP